MGISTIQKFRPGCYVIMHCDNQALVVEKMRGQLIGLYDLPGGGIDHGEHQLETMVREIREEIGLEVTPDRLELLDIFNHVLNYEKGEVSTSMHMIGIVYSLSLDPETFADVLSGEVVGTEIGGDAGKRMALNFSDIESAGLTPICQKALITFASQKI